MTIKAQSDLGTKLYTGDVEATSGLTQLISVISVPATGSDPAQIEVTELDDEVKSYIADRKDVPVMTFGFNYTEAKVTSLGAIDGMRKQFVIQWQDGSGIKIIGSATFYSNALSRGSAVEGSLSIVAESVSVLTKTQVDALIATGG